jgi:hypothetical protein
MIQNDPRAIALGLSTDNFCPASHVANVLDSLLQLQLTPTLTGHTPTLFLFCADVISRPNQPTMFDTFLYSLVDEL